MLFIDYSCNNDIIIVKTIQFAPIKVLLFDFIIYIEQLYLYRLCRYK